MTSSEEACISQQLLYRWDSIFDTPRIASDRYDEPFVNNVGDGETANPSIDVIRFFMQAFDGDDSCHFATDTVVDFCEGANLSNLQRNESATTQLVALLNDSGGMTARDLLEALAQSRSERTRHSQEVERVGNSTPPIGVRIDETNIKINRL